MQVTKWNLLDMKRYSHEIFSWDSLEILKHTFKNLKKFRKNYLLKRDKHDMYAAGDIYDWYLN